MLLDSRLRLVEHDNSYTRRIRTPKYHRCSSGRRRPTLPRVPAGQARPCNRRNWLSDGAGSRGCRAFIHSPSAVAYSLDRVGRAPLMVPSG